MPFRFNAKRVFLTYPQCGDLSKDQVQEFLRDTRGATWYCVGLEQHADGGNHIHAYAEWPERLDSCDERYFDVGGQHPNIQSVRRPAHVLRYVQKGGDYIGNCEAQNGTTVRYGEIVEQSTGPEDFLARALQNYPRDTVLHLERLQYFADWKWRDRVDEYVPEHSNFAVPTVMSDWVSVNLEGQVCILSYLLDVQDRSGGAPVPSLANCV